MGIVAFLVCAAIIAVWKLIAEKPSRAELGKAIEVLDTDIKLINARIDQSLAAIAGAVSKTDLMERIGTATTRTDDQDRRVQKDIAELKTDLKTLAEKLVQIDKKLDELPTRVSSLEATRNQNQK
jgi:chromosome segregation ATPase